jgi:uncharacterized protein
MYRNAYTCTGSYQWDSAKARANRAKHGISFADAVGVFEDPRASTLEDPHPDEDRYVTLGMDFLGRVLVVSWTWRDEETPARGPERQSAYRAEGIFCNGVMGYPIRIAADRMRASFVQRGHEAA